ncbi:hypothetical protein EZV77_29960 [Burkholderia thailandensis]|nr:hypothetical protein A8H31_22255 [Burkholderia thailandensis]AVR23835.1 hypothetical protein A8H32_00605 [Burkholderia thailandensis]AWY57216.1 hypothetical protein A8H35_00890 [Burkholderia thailandensis]AWY68630.1 hypothetical protein A8H36_27480 [Burkholderia thailandensis]MDD1481003.1 hypothetical protein [Burkholderia thailandensis]
MSACAPTWGAVERCGAWHAAVARRLRWGRESKLSVVLTQSTGKSR